MALRGGATRFERRQRERWRMAAARLLLQAGIVAAIAYWAYDMGRDRAGAGAQNLASRAERFETENARLREETEAAIDARDEARRELSELRVRYETDAPTGTEREILDAVRRRTSEGVAPERIVEVVSVAQPDPRCVDDVLMRRFVVQTPMSTGAGAAAGFAGNAITITGSGAAARDAQGNPEAWFDTGRPVRIAFAAPGGAETVREGLLPLHHSIAIGAKAHNFTVTAGRRGFVNVTEQVCDYP